MKNEFIKTLRKALPHWLDFNAAALLATGEEWRRDPQKAAYIALEQSGLFDDEEYFQMYPEARAYGIGALRHWLKYGIYEHKKPCLRHSAASDFKYNGDFYGTTQPGKTARSCPDPAPEECNHISSAKAATKEEIRKIYDTTFNSGHYVACLDLIKKYGKLLADKKEELVSKKVACLRRLRCYSEALEEIRKLKKSPNEIPFPMTTIELEMLLHDYDQAYVIILRMLEAQDKSKKYNRDLLRHIIRHAIYSSKFATGLKYAELALTENPGNTDFLAYKMRLLACSGIIDEALSCALKLYNNLKTSSYYEIFNHLRNIADFFHPEPIFMIIDLRRAADPQLSMDKVAAYLEQLCKFTNFNIIGALALYSDNSQLNLTSYHYKIKSLTVKPRINLSNLFELASQANGWIGYMDCQSAFSHTEFDFDDFILKGAKCGALIGENLHLYKCGALKRFQKLFITDDLEFNSAENLADFAEYFEIIKNRQKLAKEPANNGLIILPSDREELPGAFEIAARCIRRQGLRLHIAKEDGRGISYSQTELPHGSILHNGPIQPIIQKLNPDMIWYFAGRVASLIEDLKYTKGRVILEADRCLSGDAGLTGVDIACKNRIMPIAGIDQAYVNTLSKQREILANHGLVLPILNLEAGFLYPAAHGADAMGFENINILESNGVPPAISSSALENNELKPNLSHFANSHAKRILVSLGSGIGNMVMASVAVKKLAEYFQTPVDVLISNVPPSSAILFANSPYVNMVFANYELTTKYFYDLAFITKSTPAYMASCLFNASKICRTQDLYDYKDYRSMHESEMELKSLQHFLKIPYIEEDIYQYAIRPNPNPPAKKRGRIGFHAGCKSGIWEKKRWPYFERLAIELKLRGYEVVSLGTCSEYVKGTINATAQDSWDIAEQIMACEYVISNDSGIGHLAKALAVRGTLLTGPTYIPKLLPYGGNWTVLRGNAPCMPCYVRGDFTSAKCDSACMASITIESVLQTVEEYFEKGKK